MSALRALPRRYPDKVETLTQALPKGGEKTALGTDHVYPDLTVGALHLGASRLTRSLPLPVLTT